MEVYPEADSNRHLLRVPGQEPACYDLNEFNHGRISFGSKEAFDRAKQVYVSAISKEYCMVTDGITGKELEVDKQLVNINLANESQGTVEGLDNVKALVGFLKLQLGTHDQHRTKGLFCPQPVLIMAEAGVS